MKICCISDAHLGYMHRMRRERIQDYERAFIEALDKAMAYLPGIILLCGDLAHHSRPDPRTLRLLVNKIIEAAEKTKVVLLIGNHEIEGHLSTAYTPLFSDLHENIHVLSTEKPRISLEAEGRKINVHGFQFIRNREQAEAELKKIAGEARKEKDALDILCLHQAVEDYLSPYEISMKSLKDASSKYDLIILGHVHKHQKISGLAAPAFYVGATERTSFNEAENSTGFLVFDDKDFWNPTHVEVSSKKMKRIRRDVGRKTPAEVNEEAKRLVEENKDAQCLQIELEVDLEGDYFDVRTDWENDYRHFSALSVNVIPRVRDQEIRIEKTSISRDVFEEYFQKKDMRDRKELMDLCIRSYERYGK